MLVCHMPICSVMFLIVAKWTPFRNMVVALHNMILKIYHSGVAAMAPWFRLHLPYCGLAPGSNPKQTIYAFSICIIEIVMRKMTKIFKRRLGLAHLKNNLLKSNSLITHFDAFWLPKTSRVDLGVMKKVVFVLDPILTTSWTMSLIIEIKTFFGTSLENAPTVIFNLLGYGDSRYNRHW